MTRKMMELGDEAGTALAIYWGLGLGAVFALWVKYSLAVDGASATWPLFWIGCVAGACADAFRKMTEPNKGAANFLASATLSIWGCALHWLLAVAGMVIGGWCLYDLLFEKKERRGWRRTRH